jgi:hypothetical protein
MPGSSKSDPPAAGRAEIISAWVRHFGYTDRKETPQNRAMRLPPAAAKWCHVTWPTARHRKCFNIAVHAKFCEQALMRQCAREGWPAEVAVMPNRVHILLAVPAVLPRHAVLSRLLAIAGDVARRAGAAGQVREGRAWCAVLTNAAAVQAVRRHIRARAASLNTPGASAPP